MIAVAFVALGVAAVCFAYRLIVGPRLTDRVIGLDGLIIVGVSGVALRAMSSGNGSVLPELVVVTLVGSLRIGDPARFIEGRVDADPDAAAAYCPQTQS